MDKHHGRVAWDSRVGLSKTDEEFEQRMEVAVAAIRIKRRSWRIPAFCQACVLAFALICPRWLPKAIGLSSMLTFVLMVAIYFTPSGLPLALLCCGMLLLALVLHLREAISISESLPRVEIWRRFASARELRGPSCGVVHQRAIQDRRAWAKAQPWPCAVSRQISNRP